MKRALIASLAAWLTGFPILFVYFFFIQEEARRTPSSPADLGQGFLIVAGIVAVVVFPLCLLVAAPLFRWLMRASSFWTPARITAAGIAAGPVFIYLVSALYLHHFFVPDFRTGETWLLTLTSALVGGVFSFIYARLYRRTHPV